MNPFLSTVEDLRKLDAIDNDTYTMLVQDIVDTFSSVPKDRHRTRDPRIIALVGRIQQYWIQHNEEKRLTR